LEKWWSTPDAWDYKTTEDDYRRKEIILNTLEQFGEFNRALDIGCGEGFLTTDLPAKKIEGYEISDNAAARLPKNVKRTTDPIGHFDLVVATGVLYRHYFYERLHTIIRTHASGIVLTCNIKEWEVNQLPPEKQILELEFPYREFTQKLRVYKWQ
jgi:hypothetical protein